MWNNIDGLAAAGHAYYDSRHSSDAPTVNSSGRGDQLHRVAQSAELPERRGSRWTATGRAAALLALRCAEFPGVGKEGYI